MTDSSAWSGKSFHVRVVPSATSPSSVAEFLMVLGSRGLDGSVERLLGKHPSAPFNPLIANAFFRAGFIESWGRGIEKIREECRSHGIADPEVDASMSGLMLTFHASADYAKALRKDPGTEHKGAKRTVVTRFRRRRGSCKGFSPKQVRAGLPKNTHTD